MTDRAKALKALLSKIEAGDVSVNEWRSFSALESRRGVHVDRQTSDAMRAYNGSLDAAKALHEAVLPDWTWNVWQSGAHVRPDPARIDGTPTDNAVPARAWLCAILKALISQEEPRP